MLHHAGMRISDYDISGLFGPAYFQASTMDKGINGFRCTGIYPFNPDVFAESDFAPSSTTDNSDGVHEQSVTAHVIRVTDESDIILPAIENGQTYDVQLIGLSETLIASSTSSQQRKGAEQEAIQVHSTMVPVSISSQEMSRPEQIATATTSTPMTTSHTSQQMNGAQQESVQTFSNGAGEHFKPRNVKCQTERDC